MRPDELKNTVHDRTLQEASCLQQVQARVCCHVKVAACETFLTTKNKTVHDTTLQEASCLQQWLARVCRIVKVTARVETD